MPISVDHAVLLKQFFAGNVRGEHAMTLNLIEQLDDDSIQFALAEGLPNIGTEMCHLFKCGVWFLSVIRRGQADWLESRTATFNGCHAELLAECRDLSTRTKALLDSFEPHELVRDVDFNNERFPAIYMVDWHIVHLVHHRAKVVSTLLAHGMTPRVFYGLGDRFLLS